MLLFVVLLNCIALYWCWCFLYLVWFIQLGWFYIILFLVSLSCRDPKRTTIQGITWLIEGGLQWARIGIGSLWRWVCHTGTVLTAPWCQKTDYMAWIRLLEISEEESVSNGSDPSFYLDNRTVVWSRCWEISPLTDSLINASQREAVIPLTVLGGLQECILEPRTLREQEKPS